MPGDHCSSGVSARDIVRPDARRKHRIPPPERLFPKGLHPGELAILDQVLIAAPDIVHQNVETVLFFTNLAKHCLDL